MPDTTTRHDVLVVGGGPAGAATGYWLAKAGHDVVVIEQELPPRRRRAATASPHARCNSSTTWGCADGSTTTTATTGCGPSPTASPSSCTWPEHPMFPNHGYVVRRRVLDTMVAEHAVKSGATLLAGHRGGAPMLRDGLVRGATVEGQGHRPERATSGPATSWSPKAPTRASVERSAPAATAATPGHGHPRLLRQPPADDAWIESGARRPRPQRRLAPRLRLDLPAGRRQDQRGHRSAVDVPRLQVGQHHPPHERVGSSPLPSTGALDPETPRPRPPADACRWAARSTPRSGPPGSSSATPPVRSTRSTARASTTPTRPAAWPPTCSTRRSPTGDGLAAAALPAPARRGVRPLLQGGPAVRAGDRAARRSCASSPVSACTAARSWSGCCAIMANLLEPDELGPAEAVYRTVAATGPGRPEPASA